MNTYNSIKNIYENYKFKSVSYPIFINRAFKHIANTNARDIIILPYGKAGKKMLLISDRRLKEFLNLLK